jgi:hypothetical protein
MAAESFDVMHRIAALETALDGALRSARHRFTPEEVRRGGKIAARRRWARILFERTHPSNVVNALANAALNAEEDGPLAASLSWERLEELTGMSEDELGGVIFGLLTARKVCCLTGGAERLYYLPASVREKLRRKRATEELRKRAA